MKCLKTLKTTYPDLNYEEKLLFLNELTLKENIEELDEIEYSFNKPLDPFIMYLKGVGCS